MVEAGEFEWGGADYDVFCRMRQQYLRAPLELDLFAEDLAAEREHRHFGLYEDERLVGGASIVPHADGSAQLRQMLVTPEFRRRGLGRLLVRHMEAALREHSVPLLYMNARLEAVDFYARCGYTCVGDEFVHATIPHLRMEKML